MAAVQVTPAESPEAPAASLLSLPEAVLTHIAQLSKAKQGKSRKLWWHPMLYLSRGCRDAVLRSLHSISPPKLGYWDFKSLAEEDGLISSRRLKVWGQLLHRAASLASPGLKVYLQLQYIQQSLPHLLQPGISSGGWSKVHSLQVTQAEEAVHLIPVAFPGLHTLLLFNTNLGNGGVFSALAAQSNSALRTLKLSRCKLDESASKHAAMALAQLPGLTALDLVGDGLSLAGQLTGLVSFSYAFDSRRGSAVEGFIRVAKQNTGLLHLSAGWEVKLTGDHLLSILSSCTSLAELTLDSGVLDGPALDVLLQHGKSITRLTLGGVSVTASRVDSACSWRALNLRGRDCGTLLQQLAALPLTSVQQLSLPDTKDGLEFQVPRDPVPAAELLALLRKAATNLAASPAWQNAPVDRLAVFDGCQVLDSDLLGQVWAAIAPLGGAHLQHFSFSARVQLTRQDVEALAGSLGGGVQTLTLQSCQLEPGFWRALSQQFQQLRRIQFLDGVDMPQATQVDLALYMAMHCRASAQPVQLSVNVNECIEACLRDWQLDDILHCEQQNDYDDDDDDYDYYIH